MLRPLSAAAILALLSSACSTPSEIATERTNTGAPPVGSTLPVTRLRAEPYSFAYYSAMKDSVRLTVRDAGEWQQAWSAVGHGTPLPQVDFGQEMVIVAALGQRNSGGYSIYVDSAYQRDGHVEVVVRKVSPGAQCGTTAALTEPVDIARLPASTQPVRFRERSLVHNCG
jgi:Tfp pilus assembly protein FimT